MWFEHDYLLIRILKEEIFKNRPTVIFVSQLNVYLLPIHLYLLLIIYLSSPYILPEQSSELNQ